mmetsp:Transcript_42923/g.69172  ORF Transcript_42923/g.69172 Transcript_42923/m.69172 type:complete len:120 (+) Transcript_42923:412-771(+)
MTLPISSFLRMHSLAMKVAVLSPVIIADSLKKARRSGSNSTAPAAVQLHSYWCSTFLEELEGLVAVCPNDPDHPYQPDIYLAALQAFGIDLKTCKKRDKALREKFKAVITERRKGRLEN